MNSSFRTKAEKRLPDVPHEILVTSLLNLAETSEEVERLVDELITTNDEALASFKRKLSGLKRRKRFYRYSEAHILVTEIEGVLRLLDHENLCPREVLSALVSFFEADSKIMELGDDSDGEIGNVFSFDATQRLVQTASRIDDQEFLQKTFKKLYQDNGYGVRDRIVEHASEFLTEESLRKLYHDYTGGAPDCRGAQQARILAEGLSGQLKDPELFEAELRKVSEHYYCAKLPELAEVYLAAGRLDEVAENLEKWLSLVPAQYKSKLEKLAQEIYAETNDQGSLIKTLTGQFLSAASSKAYQSLSKILSPADLSALVDRLREAALKRPSLNFSQVHFFLENGEPDTAASLVSKFSQNLNGDLYYPLPDLAKAFEAAGQALAATLVFRALLLSILKRATTNAYGHAARYLQTLQNLSQAVSNWEPHQDHSRFLQELHEVHYRKTSFWKRVPDEIKSVLTQP
ncbi:hypothetical protein V2O64_24210 (plasmid) [Verrucomicrobiaceae bacterium 227]